MALLQVLLSLITRSAGKILNAIFGWAVVALFGRSSPKQQTLLSALVGMAAAWPLLMVGIAFPKIAALVLAFVPLSDRVPDWIVRLVWIGLALAVPLVIGLVMAKKTPPPAREAFIRRLLRGFPITLGLAGAFLLMFVTVPVLRMGTLLRGRKDEHVPCITEADDYGPVSHDIQYVLTAHRLDVARSEPSWWLSAPYELLQKLGGKALRAYIPDRLAYWKGPNLEVAFYPSDILIRGKKKQTAFAHGVLAEALARSPGLQTFDLEAQNLERQLKRLWRVLEENPRAHVGSRALSSRLRDVSLALGRVELDYDDWQVLYRQTLQLGRELDGRNQLLESLTLPAEEVVESKPIRYVTRPSPADAPTAELVTELMREAGELVRAEVALAKCELQADMKREIEMVAAAAGLIGWSKRVKRPLEKTQKTLKEDVQWAKERTA